MARPLFLLLFLFTALPLAAAQSPLAGHPSPYLAMHANDPVQWRLWDETVLRQAQRERRLIFISSGYFACHWCHVMQRESFRNRLIAARINRDFIPVKIDRELWPELDAALIDFVDRTRGGAGWPLNVFLTPDGHPLVGTTYLPPEGFTEFLQRLQTRWLADAQRLSSLAAAAATRAPETTPTAALELSPQVLEQKLLQALQQRLAEHADHLVGGLGSAAKFPQTPLLGNLLALEALDGEEEFVQLTLDAMAGNALRDHLGGGFFRYTVDPGWQVPHFEKMLYDNAQLAALYLQAAERWEDRGYRRIGLETLDFMLKRMRHADGGFIASLSAVDEHGVEGGNYLWTPEELELALGERQAQWARDLWGMRGALQWERGYLPLPQSGVPAAVEEEREALRARLLQQRQRRVLPRDEKRLAAWNALALCALSEAYEEDARFVVAGREVRDYLHRLWDGKRLWRMGDETGRRWQPAGLADHALTALCLLRWDAVEREGRSRQLAARLVATAWQRFHDEDGWLPGGEPALVGRPQAVLAEGAVPSPVVALFRANRLLGEQAPINRASMVEALRAEPVTLLNAPLEYSGYLILLQRLHGG